MGNTTSMREPHMKGTYEHQHGDVTCTMKHGRRRRHHRTAKHHSKKHSGKKHHGTKHKRSGYKRSGKKHSGGIGVVTP